MCGLFELVNLSRMYEVFYSILDIIIHKKSIICGFVGLFFIECNPLSVHEQDINLNCCQSNYSVTFISDNVSCITLPIYLN